MSILVRKMDKKDISAWGDMRIKLWSKYSINEHLDEIAKLLIKNKILGYMALLPENLPIGFAEVSIREYANGCTKQPVPFLEGIWIDPQYRRKGIGQVLIEKITDELIIQGFCELCSDTEINNRRSQQAHEHWGFDETERVICFRKRLI